MADDDSFVVPKSGRQLQDKIYRENANKIPKTVPGNIIADEILTIIGQLHDNPFVQSVTMTKGKQPVIILYTDDQILDLKKNCLREEGSVIGIDRTFNLGGVFVTTMCYKNRSIVSRKSNQYPIFLGPICLHWDEWKQLKLPELVDRLSSVTKTQIIDLGRALYGAGNYKLSGQSISFLLDNQVWHSKSVTEKEKYFKKFLAAPIATVESSYVHSSDGTYKCKRPKQTAGRKPGQRKDQELNGQQL
ncbi:hypothetical protein ACJMK2_028777 [Sinanodonta woodiana]|uniref:Uncharacterized protein n=1 Tax=Sinanodonta woodiana TaxID=1069815 RepID=A0ABD3XAE8_SINWO